MISHWAYILIGNDKTGKTNFQKYLINNLCDLEYERLHCNLRFEICHPRIPHGVKTISLMNRSYQEKDYESVDVFFAKHFQDADICILSSHVKDDSANDIEEMTIHLKRRAKNVAAVFFSNGFNNDAQNISLLEWDERLFLQNDLVDQEMIPAQLNRLADDFSDFLINRSVHW